MNPLEKLMSYNNYENSWKTFPNIGLKRKNDSGDNLSYVKKITPTNKNQEHFKTYKTKKNLNKNCLSKKDFKIKEGRVGHSIDKIKRFNFKRDVCSEENCSTLSKNLGLIQPIPMPLMQIKSKFIPVNNAAVTTIKKDVIGRQELNFGMLPYDMSEKPIIQNFNAMIQNLTNINFIQETAPKDKENKELLSSSKNFIPDLTGFESDLLKKFYPDSVKMLYGGKQCNLCSDRFNQDTQSKHLDWHFRINMKEKNEKNKFPSRKWNDSLADWVTISAENNKQNFLRKKMTSILPSENKIVSSCSLSNEIVKKCAICKESFEEYWCDEKEEWYLKNAIKKSNDLYHPSCL
jgi:hypothetical protein